MAEILLCNQPTTTDVLGNQLGLSIDNVSGLSCVNPETLNSYTPYSIEGTLSSQDRGILNLLSPQTVARDLTNLSLSLGGDNVLAMAEITSNLQQYNIGLMGASTSMYANRIGGFAGAVQKYQHALMQYRDAARSNSSLKAVAKQKVIKAFQEMQQKFHYELKVVNSAIKSKKGTPLSSSTRGINIARSSRTAVKLDVSNTIQANNLVKLSKQAKFLGGGLVAIDFASRIGNIQNSYKADGEWERELFVESSSFVLSAAAGGLAINAGSAALGLLVVATPIGWVGLLIGGVAVAGTAAGISIAANDLTKSNASDVYDYIMGLLN